MFHLFKTAYLEYDYKFDSIGYKFVMASPLVGDGIALPMSGPLEKDILYPVTHSFESLLNDNFNGKIDKFWEKLYMSENKIICYLLPEDLNKLQIQYWKSIFSNSTINDVYFLHKTWIESIRLRSYINTTARDYRNYETRQKLKILSFDEFKNVYESTQISNFLKNGIDFSKISFEYLLADYFYNGSSSSMKTELLNRVKIISVDNFRDELEQLKLEIIFGFLDVNKLYDTIKPEVGTLEEQMKNSKLSWALDDNFNTDPKYMRENYNYLDFIEQFNKINDKVYSIRSEEDYMKVLTESTIFEKWEELLMEDIKRNYGCIYTWKFFKEKGNQVLATYIYQKIRENKTQDLSPFRLD